MTERKDKLLHSWGFNDAQTLQLYETSDGKIMLRVVAKAGVIQTIMAEIVMHPATAKSLGNLLTQTVKRPDNKPRFGNHNEERRHE